MKKIFLIAGLLSLLMACGKTNEQANNNSEQTDTVAATPTIATDTTPALSVDEQNAKVWEGDFEAVNASITIQLTHQDGNKYTGTMHDDYTAMHETYDYKIAATLEGDVMSIRQTSGTYEGSDYDDGEAEVYSGKVENANLKSLKITKKGDSFTLKFDGNSFALNH